MQVGVVTCTISCNSLVKLYECIYYLSTAVFFKKPRGARPAAGGGGSLARPAAAPYHAVLMAVLERDPSRFADSGVSGRPESARRGRAAAHGAAGTPPPAGGNMKIWTIYPWPIPRWSMGGGRPKPPIKMHWPYL